MSNEAFWSLYRVPKADKSESVAHKEQPALNNHGALLNVESKAEKKERAMLIEIKDLSEFKLFFFVAKYISLMVHSLSKLRCLCGLYDR